MADVAVVCGAGGALGSALVDLLSGRGDRVVAVDRTGAADGGKLRREEVDLSSADEVGALWDRLVASGERPRWVVNAAGGFRTGTVADSEPETVTLLEQLNLATAWWSCREAARHLADGGAIVNIAARAAVRDGAGAAAYAVSKAAVVRLTEVLAVELAPRRVRVNALLPALIDTPANRAAMSDDALRHAVSPQQVAAVVGFLLSDTASAVTGALIPV